MILDCFKYGPYEFSFICSNNYIIREKIEKNIMHFRQATKISRKECHARQNFRNPLVGVLTIFFVLALILSAGCIGTSSNKDKITTSTESPTSSNSSVNKKVPVTILADYRDKGYSGVIKVPTFTKIDDAACLNYLNNQYDGNYKVNQTINSSSGLGLCSCCIKPLEYNGKKETVMGRNLDYANSYSPVAIFYVNASDRYRSVNIAPTSLVSVTFDSIVETNSMDRQIYEKIPYLAFDSMNECGLILELNMRPRCDALLSTSTNPNGNPRICFYNLIRYLSDTCANIEEVLQKVKIIDIYSPNSSVLNWNGGIAMMDATGRYGVLEIVDNEICWSEGAPGQTNFWQNKDAYERSDLNLGLGRWDVLMNEYSHISSEKDMENVMKMVTYGQFFTKDWKDIPYSVLTENVNTNLEKIMEPINIGIQKYDLKYDKEKYDTLEKIAKKQAENNIVWTTSYVLDPKNKEEIESAIRAYFYLLNLLPLDECKRAENVWLTVASYVVNNKDLIYHIKFFEQDDVFDIPLNP